MTLELWRLWGTVFPRGLPFESVSDDVNGLQKDKRKKISGEEDIHKSMNSVLKIQSLASPQARYHIDIENDIWRLNSLEIFKYKI